MKLNKPSVRRAITAIKDQSVMKFTAKSWTTVAGRGRIATIDIGSILPPRVGDIVFIDGKLETVVGVEVAMLLISPPRMNPVIGLVVRGKERSDDARQNN